MRISDLSGQISSLAKLPAGKESEDEVERGAKKVADFISRIDWTKISVKEADDLSKAGKLLHQQSAPRFKDVQKEFDKLEEHLPKGDLTKAKGDFQELSTKTINKQSLSPLHKKYGKDVLNYLMQDREFAYGFAKNCAENNPEFLMDLGHDLLGGLSGDELVQVAARLKDPEDQKSFSRDFKLSADAVKKAHAEFLKSQ
jgi:hypothetical protein